LNFINATNVLKKELIMQKTLRKQEQTLVKFIYSALCIALAMILPLVTGNIQQIGNMLCPMHFPVLICGLVCGWQYGLVVGFISPLLRFLIFGMPPVIPIGLSMAFELATYGLIAGLLYGILNKRSYKVYNVYISLIVAMIIGRVVWGIARMCLTGLTQTPFTLKAFLSGAVTMAVPGIILQIVLIPVIILALDKANLTFNRQA